MSNPTNHYDTVIIGSGFGGSVSALRISEQYQNNNGGKTGEAASKPILLIERGQDWWGNLTGKPVKQPPFCNFRQPDGRAGWMTTEEPFGTPVVDAPLNDIPLDFNDGPQAKRPITKYPGLVETIKAKNMTVWVGAGLGGTSQVYNTFFEKPTPDAFNLAFRDPESPNSPTPIISFDTVEQYYTKVDKIMQPTEITSTTYDANLDGGSGSKNLIDAPDFRSTRVFKKQVETLQEQVTSDSAALVKKAEALKPQVNKDILPIASMEFNTSTLALDWDVVAQEVEAKMLPSAIIGEMWYGMNSHSVEPNGQLKGLKKSLDQNYLKQAKELGYLEIRCLTEVTRIVQEAPKSYRIYTTSYTVGKDAHGGLVMGSPTQGSVVAKNVVFSAGSMHTARLLLESANNPNPINLNQLGLPELSTYVGKFWGQNGDLFVTQSTLENTRPANGGPGSADVYISYVKNMTKEEQIIYLQEFIIELQEKIKQLGESSGQNPKITQLVKDIIDIEKMIVELEKGPVELTVNGLEFLNKNHAAPYTRAAVYPSWFEESVNLQNTLMMGVCKNTAPGSFEKQADGRYQLTYPETILHNGGTADTYYYQGGMGDSINTAWNTLRLWSAANTNVATQPQPIPINFRGYRGPWGSTETSAFHSSNIRNNQVIKADTPLENDLFDIAYGMTPHPLGGCVLGKACDKFGRLLDKQQNTIPGIYVVDASLIPGSSAACTPAWTIAAIAEYCMEEVANEIANTQ